MFCRSTNCKNQKIYTICQFQFTSSFLLTAETGAKVNRGYRSFSLRLAIMPVSAVVLLCALAKRESPAKPGRVKSFERSKKLLKTKKLNKVKDLWSAYTTASLHWQKNPLTATQFFRRNNFSINHAYKKHYSHAIRQQSQVLSLQILQNFILLIISF